MKKDGSPSVESLGCCKTMEGMKNSTSVIKRHPENADGVNHVLVVQVWLPVSHRDKAGRQGNARGDNGPRNQGRTQNLGQSQGTLRPGLRGRGRRVTLGRKGRKQTTPPTKSRQSPWAGSAFRNEGCEVIIWYPLPTTMVPQGRRILFSHSHPPKPALIGHLSLPPRPQVPVRLSRGLRLPPWRLP